MRPMVDESLTTERSIKLSDDDWTNRAHRATIAVDSGCVGRASERCLATPGDAPRICPTFDLVKLDSSAEYGPAACGLLNAPPFKP